ncbi:Hypothetical protein ING2D1G_0158 [Peptoniphilus sp. ING2-D1G]|nr:Hypothetical protein ING2D1G_0158 [Peptoniphilus sp. ING2-D1G]
MNDQNNKSFNIQGGDSSVGKGGYGLIAEDIDIDFRKSNTSNSGAFIRLAITGGNGKYPGEAVKGKNIYMVAGRNMIKPGVGTVADIGITFLGENYTATVEVEDGGKLIFGKSKSGKVINHKLDSALNGFSDSYYYGPTILARGNSEVEIYGGEISGTTANIYEDTSTVPQAPTIHMGTGKLSVINQTQGAGEYAKNIDQQLIIFGGTHRSTTSKATIVSDGEIFVSGNSSIQGPYFPVVVGSTGYSDNPMAPKTGAAGIYSTGYIHITKGAHVMGGGLQNIDDALKANYRYGSGIIGNGQNTVRVDEGATVQGFGSVTYSREDQKQIKFISVNTDIGNMSAGHGIENVGKVYINDGNVHGGDIHTPASSTGQTGSGTGGIGIKGVPEVEISGASLVTGGSSTGPQTGGSSRKPILTNFMYGMEAGSAIENDRELPSGNIAVSDSAKIYGGTSALKGGSGIVGYENVQIKDYATVLGGASKSGEAGTGIFQAVNVKVSSSTVEAGNMPFQSLMTDYYDKQRLNFKDTKVYYPDALHADSKTEAYGTSTNAVAIQASGEVIVDGTETTMPKISSYCIDFAASTPTELKSAPVVSLIADDAILYVGKAKANGPAVKSNLVEGGRYHVDIFKENIINTHRVVDGEDAKGIQYNDNSVGLYRILVDDKTPPTDVKITDMNHLEFMGLLLYPEGQAASLILDNYVRKNTVQDGTVAVDAAKKSVDVMPDDNIVLGFFEVQFMRNTDTLGDTQEQLIKSAKASEQRESKWYVQESEFPQNLTYTDAKGQKYILKGWNTKKDGTGEEFTSDYAVTQDIKVYAQWEKVSDENPNPQPKPDPNPNPKPKPEPKHDLDNYPRVRPLIIDYPKEKPIIEKHIAYIKGYEDKTVRADGNLTRAEAAAMVTRLAKLDLRNEEKPDYIDVEEGAWYNKYLNAALKANMLDSENQRLRPDEKITRAEFAKMLAAIDKDNNFISDFEDIKGHKYEREINKISGNKRIQGYEDGSFRPDGLLTRAEAATMLNRMFNRVADEVAIRGYEKDLVYFSDLKESDWCYYEIAEAANTHKLIRREGRDIFDRVYEDWTELLATTVE